MSTGERKQTGSLGLLSCITIIAGGMMGSAIFSLSGITIYYAGPAAIVSWIVAAVVLLMYGLQVAELSAIFPKSGGVFVFPARALGKSERQGSVWGWFSTWGYVNANIVAIAFAAIYVATYLGVGFPVFSGFQVPLAVIAVAICFFFNTLRISVAGKANTVLVVGLMTTLLIFVGVGLFGGSWDASQFVPFFGQGAKGTAGFTAAIPIAMVAYGSIVAIAFMVSEVKNPEKNVPLSATIAMAVVVVLYTLVIVTTVGLISATYLANNPGMRFIPLYAAAFTKLSSIPWLAKVISVSAVLALLTTMLVVMALTSRAISASAESGLLPRKLAELGRRSGTPVYATLVVAVLSMVVASFPQFTAQIVDFGSLFAAITISINCVSLLVARRKFPASRPRYKAPGGSVVPVLTLAIIVASYVPGIVAGGWQLWAYTLGWYVVGGVVLAHALSRQKALAVA